VTGLVNQERLLRNEYVIAENRIFPAQSPIRFAAVDPERATLAEVAKLLGRKGLHEVTQVAKPDTILGWYRRLTQPSTIRLTVRAGRTQRDNGKDRIPEQVPLCFA
jgi:hypothetical protein